MASFLTIGYGILLAGDGTPGEAPPRPEFAEVVDDPRLPRVLLIGDSISISYTLPVRALLAGKANVHRIPENGGPTSHGLERLEAWLGTGRWDLIHFNFGLHDIRRVRQGPHQVSLPQYEANLRQIVQRLRATGATLLWASTTPVPDLGVNPPRCDTDVRAYNAAALGIMEENGIAVNDLYADVAPNLAALQFPANVHFTAEGARALGRRVAACIETALQSNR
jgi:acyl-CoA thioesterase-1